MSRLYALLSYWSGCLSVVVLTLGMLCLPGGFVQAEYLFPPCGQVTTSPFGCPNPGAGCDCAGHPSTCGGALSNPQICTCCPNG